MRARDCLESLTDLNRVLTSYHLGPPQLGRGNARRTSKRTGRQSGCVSYPNVTAVMQLSPVGYIIDS